MIEPWAGYPGCPCGLLDCFGQKIANATGHVKGCICVSCRGRSNRSAGHRSQDRAHKKLGGSGRSREHEEANKPYTVEVTLQAESKIGGQVPQSWRDFIGSRWFEDARRQAERAVPFGSGALPAVAVDDSFVVVDIRTRRERERSRAGRSGRSTASRSGSDSPAR